MGQTSLSGSKTFSETEHNCSPPKMFGFSPRRKLIILLMIIGLFSDTHAADESLKERFEKITRLTQISKLGEGRYGTVYRCQDTSETRPPEDVLEFAMKQSVGKENTKRLQGEWLIQKDVSMSTEYTPQVLAYDESSDGETGELYMEVLGPDLTKLL